MIHVVERAVLAALAVVACACQPAPAAVAPLARSIIVHNWAGYLPEQVLSDFTAETGITVEILPYDNYEQARDTILNGPPVDVVMINSESLPDLIAAGQLAVIDYRNVPNIKNVAANFRDLVLDPGNRHSVPWWWGTTGIVFRTDLGLPRPERWADLARPDYRGHVALWDVGNVSVGVALKAVGQSINNEDPSAYEAAQDWLLALKPHVVVPSPEATDLSGYFASGEVWVGYGWPYDYNQSLAAGVPVEYILPEDGSILWSEHLVIPVDSEHKTEAEQFINFLHRAEIAARVAYELDGSVANDAALAHLPPEFLADPLVFPSNETLQGAEIALPLSADTYARAEAIWARFMDGKAYREVP